MIKTFKMGKVLGVAASFVCTLWDACVRWERYVR